MTFSDKQKLDDQLFDQWVQSEIWFMRGSGVALLVLAALSAVFGIFAIPTAAGSGLAVTGLNGMIAFLMAGAGLWAIWYSTRELQMVSLVETALQQQPSRAFIVGGVQIVMGLFFTLSGLRDGLVMLLLGLLIIVAGAWFIYRGLRIRQYQG